MTDRHVLTHDEIAQARQALPHWTFSDTTMHRSIICTDFSEAFALMCRIAMLAETQDHHPDWSNSYNKIAITLSTHGAGGLTPKDLTLAKAIEALAP